MSRVGRPKTPNHSSTTQQKLKTESEKPSKTRFFNKLLIGYFSACSVICYDSPMNVPCDTSDDAGRDMKTRLRADLRTAMKNRRTIEAKVIRALIAAIDNAEAPAQEGQTALAHHDFRSGSAEIERLLLSGAHVHGVIVADIQERERAAAEMERLGMMDRAEALRAEAVIAKRYID
ncbi:MAG: hypothetical protein WCC21_04515 [Candidatus Acidiferrales bacterium]